MSIPENFAKLIGEWKGSNRLYTSWVPENPVRDSESNAFIYPTAQGKFLTLRYDWIFEGKPQDGLMILGKEKDSDKATMAWVDSWHQSNEVMLCKGIFTPEGNISVKGYFPAGDGSDWGWITIFETENDNDLRFTMFNVSPEGAEDLAVEAAFTRK